VFKRVAIIGRGRRIFYRILVVRFLDGKQPAQAEVPIGKWSKCRAITGSQAQFWLQVDGLVRIGMEADEARRSVLAWAAGSGDK
jgi:hypothetical protein